MASQNVNEGSGAAFAPKRSAATIGASVTITGEISSTEELFVDGELRGKLECNDRLTIGPNGKVQAGIKAREIVVLGVVNGNMEVEQKLTIRKGGSVVGDVKTAGLVVIEEGAYIKGGIDMAKAPKS